MWKRILLVLVLALPVAAQEVDDQQRQIDDLRSQLEEIRELLDSNNPIDLGVRITEAFEKGTDVASFTLGFISIVSVLIGVFVGILGFLGFKEIKNVKDARNEARKAKEEAREFTEITEKCAIKAEELLQKAKMLLKELEERTKRIDEVESKVESVESRFTPAYLSGLFAMDKENYEEALKHFERAIAEDPKNDGAWFQKGYCLGELSNYAEAIEAYDKAIRLKPDFYGAHLNKGNALGNLGRYDEAIEAYDEAIRLKPDFHEAHHNKGNALYKLGRYDEATEAYDEAIRIKPDYYKAHNNKAGTFLRWGANLTGEERREKFELAKRSAREALKFSNGKKGYYNLACAQAGLGELDEALDNLKKGKKIKGEEFDSVKAWADPDFALLKQGEYRVRFKEIVGPPPEGVEES